MKELLKKTATEVVKLLKKGEVSPVDLVQLSSDRIEEVEPHVNAIPTLCIEQAFERARKLMDGSQSSQRNERGWLAGLPVAIKDLTETRGVRTTFGSPIYKDYIPGVSDILIQKLEDNGAIVIGKSNTPEFGAGASTFNEVFGVTRNPWDTRKSVAGSSGGACAAVASGEVWLATGSDLGGSLRTPASFNSVVGLRPTHGRVPRNRVHDPFGCLHVQGPVARCVQDAALFLDAMSGLSPYDPLSYPAPQDPYENFTNTITPPANIAYSSDLGITMVDCEVEQICRSAADQFTKLGSNVEEACSDFSGSIESFDVLRAASFAQGLHREYEKHRNLLKPENVWNIERGLNLTVSDIARAEQTQARIYRSIIKLFEKYDLLICPCAIVPPFDAEKRYVESVGEHTFSTYYEWIAISFVLTLTGCPVLAVPAGFTKEGLPVGIQIAAPPRHESRLLVAGYLLETMTGIAEQLPIDPRVRHVSDSS